MGLETAIAAEADERRQPMHPIVWGGLERRGATRRPAQWWAEFYAGPSRAVCTVLDISETGLRLRLDRGAPSTELAALLPVMVAIPPFGTFSATLVWAKDEMAGIAFATAELPRVRRILSSALCELPR